MLSGFAQCFQKCNDITPAMARKVILALREMSVQYVVAPYEADSQLTHLVSIGMDGLHSGKPLQFVLINKF